jgi:hypothetical protein
MILIVLNSPREPSIISNASPDSTTFAGSSKLGTESSKPSESSNFLGTDPVTTSGFLHNMTGIVHGSPTFLFFLYRELTSIY